MTDNVSVAALSDRNHPFADARWSRAISVFLDILRRENRRVVRLIRMFKNEVVYSDSELEI